MSELAQTFGDWTGAVQQRTEAALDRFLPSATIAPARLHDAMRYAVLGGGKRVRPLLCHAAGALSGADPAALDAAACAVELIHAYSLVHDDMPCMDDDVLRRGKPTVHVQYDDATALLVGDSLQSLAFLVNSLLATFTVQRQKGGLIVFDSVADYLLVLAAVAAAIVLAGPGRYGFDGGRGWARRPFIGSFVALVLGIGGGVAAWFYLRGINPFA